mgnify:FL=1
MDNSVEDRLKNVMSSVFGIPKNDIRNDASPDTIDSWDSLKHMNLIVALEEEFETVFGDNDIIEMMNYKLIISVLKYSSNN